MNVRLGVFNTLEHAITRVSDAFFSLLLLWLLSPETFGRLALAQAFVAPLLLLCVAPENVLYRDFHSWREDRQLLAKKVLAYRIFSWWKLAAILFVAILFAAMGYGGGKGTEFSDRVIALCWAVFLSLAPQVGGGDRVFLRLDLRIKELFFVTALQKIGLLAGTAIVAIWFPGQLLYLVFVTGGVLVLGAFLSWIFSRKNLPLVPDAEKLSVKNEVMESLRDFSIWSHFSGVVLGWVQTMDLYFLGTFGFAERLVGLYATCVKFANLTYSFPNAMVNLYGVWMGQKKLSDPVEIASLPKVTLKKSALLFAALCVQAFVIWFISPWLFSFFSRGRWDAVELQVMRTWLSWMLIGSTLIGSGFLMDYWLLVRTKARDCALTIYLPWLLVSALTYSAAVSIHGFSGAAVSNAIVGLFFILLLWIRWFRCVG